MEQGAFMVSISCCVQLLSFILVLHGGSKPLKCLKPSYHLKKDYPLKLMKTYLFRFISSSFRIYNIMKSKPCANRRNIVGCYLLRPFAHPVACFACCWKFSCTKFETSQIFSYVQMEATTPNIVGPTKLGVVASVCMYSFTINLSVNYFIDLYICFICTHVTPEHWNNTLEINLMTKFIKSFKLIKV